MMAAVDKISRSAIRRFWKINSNTVCDISTFVMLEERVRSCDAQKNEG